MGVSAKDKRLEAILVVQERTATQLDVLSNEVGEVNETTKMLSKEVREVNETTKMLSKEVREVNETTKMLSKEVREVNETTKMLSKEVREVNETTKMLSKEVSKVNETSKNLANWGHNQRRSYERQDERVPGPGAGQCFKDLCLMWRQCHGRQARGVLAADEIPTSAVDMAVREGYQRIRWGDGAFEVQDMQAGTSALLPSVDDDDDI
eukprot:gene3629-13712_t